MESYNELERFAFLVEAKQKVTSDRGSKVPIGCEPLGDGLRPAIRRQWVYEYACRGAAIRPIVITGHARRCKLAFHGIRSIS